MVICSEFRCTPRLTNQLGQADFHMQARAVKAAEESLTISTNQYKGGIASYLQVITSQTIALQNERTAIDLLTRRMTASVLLVQALGGGWNAAQLPTVSSLTAK